MIAKMYLIEFEEDVDEARFDSEVKEFAESLGTRARVHRIIEDETVVFSTEKK